MNSLWNAVISGRMDKQKNKADPNNPRVSLCGAITYLSFPGLFGYERQIQIPLWAQRPVRRLANSWFSEVIHQHDPLRFAILIPREIIYLKQ